MTDLEEASIIDHGSDLLQAIPLELKYKYDPSTPYAPIQEIVEDRNARIKQVNP